jgi:hypothetical protein
LRDHQHILLSDEVLNHVLNFLGSLNSAFNTSVAFSSTIFELEFLHESVHDIGLDHRVLSGPLHVLDDASHHDRVLLVLVVGDLDLVAGFRLFDDGLLNLWLLNRRGGSLRSSMLGLLIEVLNKTEC